MKIIKSEKIEMTSDEKAVFKKACDMAERLYKEVTDPDLCYILDKLIDNIYDLGKYIEEAKS